MRALSTRRGFTLLEVVLALSVGVLLLGGLYVAVDVQLRHARAGRSIVEKATLARSILVRIDADIAATATLIDSERFRIANNLVLTSSGFTTLPAGAGGSSSGGSGSGGSGTSGATATAGASTTAANSTTSNGSSSTSSTNGTTDNIVLPLSVQGDSTSLNLYLARVPREALPTDASVTPPIVSDLRRVSWWLPTSGLARQEVNIETSVDALDNLPPGIPDEDSYVIAPEVKNVQFQYFDGTDWQDTWDCTTLGADNVTPIGPPVAIAITLDIENPQDGVHDDDPPTKRYRHVVACYGANGTTPQPTNGQQNGNGQPQQNGMGGTGQ
jgi:prepilin-type N-terminal cleavage/methylation domain-containing protein